MGSLAELRNTPAPALPDDWKLRQLDAASKIGGAFAELYRGFHVARPDLAEAVPPSSIDALEECARAHGLYACFSGTDVVGIAPTQPGAQYDARNLPSLRTALRVGRQIVGTWTFIEER